MGVVTTADEKIKSAKGHIKDAIDDLKSVLVDECWGHDDFTPEYNEALTDSFTDLLRINTRLK